jgi:hypothetical protein
MSDIFHASLDKKVPNEYFASYVKFPIEHSQSRGKNTVLEYFFVYVWREFNVYLDYYYTPKNEVWGGI